VGSRASTDVPETEPYTFSQYNYNGILKLLLLVFWTLVHHPWMFLSRERDWHCPPKFTDVLPILTSTSSLNLNIHLMLKEDLLSASTVQPLLYAKYDNMCIMTLINLDAIFKLNGCSLQFTDSV
jgi:hypothetical protein